MTTSSATQTLAPAISDSSRSARPYPDFIRPLSDAASPARSSRPALPLHGSARGAAAEHEVSPPARVLRFRESERRLHWAIAVPFMVCLATALTLVLVYNPAPQRPGRLLFSWIHRLSGLSLLALPILVAFRYRSDYRVYLRNIEQAWAWSLDDLKWLALLGLSALGRRVFLPEEGKFNAGEKLNFMMVTTTWPLFAVTGIMIWLPGVDILSWIAHFALAGLAAPLILGHVYMAMINPATRQGLQGMISGLVSASWARHHYRRWYRENFEKPGDHPATHTRPTAREIPRQSVPVVLVTAGARGRETPPGA